ncbi:hypothetical protein [Marinagarivorans algicola]|uniref:hypothetical protein n=1 Tax=Marinagarivorans algicola TaxID=1513270 RepID=UPI0006B55A68|nr:hypothetical protein [Marinagarivorans algicola]
MLNKISRFVLICISATLAFALSACTHIGTLEQANVYNAEYFANKQVMVRPVSIEFSSHWLRDHRRDHTQRDIDKLKQRYSDSLTRSLIAHLEKQGFTISSAPSAQVAQLRITQMRISAPDFNGPLSKLYSNEEHGAGDFALTFTHGEHKVAQFIDHRKVMQGMAGQMNLTNRSLNQHAFDRTLGRFVRDALTVQHSAPQ